MKIRKIAKAFSNGEFEKTYNFIAENAEWTVIEEDQFVKIQKFFIVKLFF
jgi:hypothetical protein